MYADLDDLMVKFGESIRSHKDFGSDCDFYGAMGLIRKFEHKLALTRREKVRWSKLIKNRFL